MKRWLTFPCAVCWALLGCSNDCVLDDDMHRFAGDGAHDCANPDANHSRKTVDACVSAAFEAKQAFVVRYSVDDGKVIIGVAMNTAGSVRTFRWQAGDAATTDVQACEKPFLPAASEDPEELPIACGSLGLLQRICG